MIASFFTHFSIKVVVPTREDTDSRETNLVCSGIRTNDPLTELEKHLGGEARIGKRRSYCQVVMLEIVEKHSFETRQTRSFDLI